MNTALPWSAAAKVYTPEATVYWPVAGAAATRVIGLPVVESITPRSATKVPLLGGATVTVYGLDAGTAVGKSNTDDLMPAVAWRPMNRLPSTPPLMSAYLAFRSVLPLPWPTATGYLPAPCSVLMSTLRSRVTSCSVPSCTGVGVAMALPAASAVGTAISLPVPKMNMVGSSRSQGVSGDVLLHVQGFELIGNGQRAAHRVGRLGAHVAANEPQAPAQRGQLWVGRQRGMHLGMQRVGLGFPVVAADQQVHVKFLGQHVDAGAVVAHQAVAAPHVDGGPLQDAVGVAPATEHMPARRGAGRLQRHLHARQHALGASHPVHGAAVHGTSTRRDTCTSEPSNSA